jgi:proteasome accessory factor A
VHQISCDVDLTETFDDEQGAARSAWDVQDELWHLAQRVREEGPFDMVAPAEEVDLILSLWREMLDGLRRDPDSVADLIDWVAKRRLVEGLRARYDLAPTSAKLRALDLQYHDIRPEKLSRLAPDCVRSSTPQAPTRPSRPRPSRPGPTSGAAVSPSTRRIWRPPTGTPSSLTWGPIRCVEFL